MSDTLELVRELVRRGEVKISEHGYDELVADDIYVDEIIVGIDEAELVEDYPNYTKGACVLVLQHDGRGRAIHVVWGVPAGASKPAVVVTAYRPDPERWSEDFRRRN